ncbi:hypothetical protein D3C77_729680 [compost metagenome]
MTVEIAAPCIPISSPKIRTAPKIIFNIDPTSVVIIENIGLPSERMRMGITKLNILKTVPKTIVSI